MTTRTKKMPKKDSVTTLRTKLRAAIANNDAVIAENVATKVEIEALQKDLEEAEKSAKHYAACYEAQLTKTKSVQDSLAMTDLNLRAARDDSAFFPIPGIITNEPDRVLRLAFCSEKDQFSIIADREMLHVTLSVDEIEALYNLLRVGGHSA